VTTTSSLVAVNGAWAGLGNRIRFTLSAESIAAVEGRDFAYVWPTRTGLFEPSFTDLWDYKAPHAPWGSVVPTMTEHKAHFSQKRRLTELRGMRNWVILGSSVLNGDGREVPWERRLQGLVPVPEIRDRVAGAQARLPERYVGVQIRASRTSHPATLEASPVSWFVDRMRGLLREDPNTHFFLSCDDAATQQEIRELVPNVATLDDKGAYNSTEGIRSAVADLYLLGGSTHLIGPYLSSFVELAWILGGASQVLENSVHRFEPGTLLHRHRPVDASFRSSPSELFVRNPLLVAWDRILARRHTP
jgi:hypothetical protein